MDSCTETPPLSPTNPPPHVNYDVILTRLDIGVSVGPVENGQLHQLHFLQVVFPLGLHQHTHQQSSTISAHREEDCHSAVWQVNEFTSVSRVNKSANISVRWKSNYDSVWMFFWREKLQSLKCSWPNLERSHSIPQIIFSVRRQTILAPVTARWKARLIYSQMARLAGLN